MTDDRRDGPAADAFRRARSQWLEGRIRELSAVLETTAPGLYRLLPADLGDPRTAAAVTLARIAADEARAQPVAESVGWLERLIPGGYRHDLAADVREVRSLIADSGEAALWAWNVEGWEELLLWWWRRHQPRTGDPERDFAEWRARWSAEVPWNGDIDRPERAPRRHGRALVTPAEFLAREPEPLRLLARAVMSAPSAVAAVEDAVLLREEHLQGAGHLRWLAEQQAVVEQAEAWRRAQQKTGSEATRAFLAELSEAVKRYMSLVLQPVTDALSACERALLHDSRPGPRRTAADYLETFLDWYEQPDVDAWDDDLGHDLAREARQRHERHETTWQGMLGTIPVWYHIVRSPQERAAALAYSGRPSASVVRVRTGDTEASTGFDLWDAEMWDEETGGQDEEAADWYPEPGVVVRCAPYDASGLCALLAVAQLGHARLEFLVPRADGGIGRLRTVRARVRRDDADAWRRWVLTSLARLAPDPEDLADLIAGPGEGGAGEGREREQDATGWGAAGPGATGRGGDDPGATGRGAAGPGAPGSGGSGSDGPGPDGPGPGGPDSDGSGPGAAGASRRAMSPELLTKVKALLRKAEDPGATQEESRAFLDKAMELMAKYGIERAMLDEVGESARPTDRMIDVHPPYAKEVRRLLSRIAQEMRCQSVLVDTRDNRRRLHLFGYESDIQASELLFASLRLQMLAGADDAGRRHRPAGEDARAYKRSWMLGFIREVTARIGAAQRAASEAADQGAADGGTHPSGRSVELVLAHRSAEVEAQLHQRYPKLGQARPTKFKGSGYWQGIADGRLADIGGPTFAEGEADPELTH
ncbi:DUF2786 domain-containing protein [Streptomyces sp. Go40/10]|uniref:DUF2786 domain-containing protein n=1 Tax=Streptomyces sp. Go40/10 TaxID=2825844 RepID=UPI001E4A7881|nr:DUF2786 domain-containing protein [Streptomyces sp. Go40/10]UFR01769.1 DUF2786 domain-containing protein [Streptomyces sp. Go40/10]